MCVPQKLQASTEARLAPEVYSIREGVIHRMSATQFLCPLITKEVPLDYLKEEMVWEQRGERRKCCRENSRLCLPQHFKVRSSQRRSLSATSFIHKFDFLKEGVVWEQSDERRKCWKENSRSCLQPFQSQLITKEVSVSNSIFSLKEGRVWEQSKERRKYC